MASKSYRPVSHFSGDVPSFGSAGHWKGSQYTCFLSCSCWYFCQTTKPPATSAAAATTLPSTIGHMGGRSIFADRTKSPDGNTASCDRCSKQDYARVCAACMCDQCFADSMLNGRATELCLNMSRSLLQRCSGGVVTRQVVVSELFGSSSFSSECGQKKKPCRHGRRGIQAAEAFSGYVSQLWSVDW